MDWLRQVKRKTIWHPKAIDPEDGRVSRLLRMTLPIVDVILAAFGIAAIIYGAPVFTAVFLGPVSVVFGALVTITSITALIGLVFLMPRLEVPSKIVLMAVFVIYPFFLTFGTFDAVRAAIGVLCYLPVPVLLWRIGDLGREEGKKQ